MRGLRLHIRWTTPDDREEVGRFYAAEGADAPDAEAGVVGKLLGEVVAHGAINRGDARSGGFRSLARSGANGSAAR